jgi:hypothetical protein
MKKRRFAPRSCAEHVQQLQPLLGVICSLDADSENRTVLRYFRPLDRMEITKRVLARPAKRS